jgi:hypothetical protein
MSSIEERLVRDIAVVTDGVVVDEADLREARRKLDEGIERGHRRQRVYRVGLAAAALALVAALGVSVVEALDGSAGKAQPGSTPTPAVPGDAFLNGAPPTAAALAGMWRVDGGATSLLFDAEGRVSIDDRGAVFGDPATAGTYEVDGYDILVTVTGNDRARCVGTTFSIGASVLDADRVSFIPPRDADTTCWVLPAWRGYLERVLPAGMVFEPDGHDNETVPVTDPADLPGDWLVAGGGFVVEIAPGGDYSVAGQSGILVDRGQWTLRGSDLTLTSSAQSAACDAGDRLVLGSLAGVVESSGGATNVQGDVTQDSCGGGWAREAWVLIPNSGVS